MKIKKFIILIVFSLFAIINYAQRGKIQTITVDTVKGNENIYLTTGEVTGSYNTLSLQAVFNKISAAAGGTAYLQGSIDGTSYTTLTSTDNFIYIYPNDTFPVTDGGVMNAIIINTPFNYYRYFIDGDVNDTVKITAKYLFK